MADGTGSGTGARAALLAGGAAVVAVVVGLLWPARAPDGPVAESPAVAPAPVAVLPEVPAESELVSDDEAAPEPEPESAARAGDKAGQEVLAEGGESAEQAAVAVGPDAVAPEPVLPGFDSYRVEADGAAVVAGRAEPMTVISVLVDGVAVAEVQAGGDGSFAALFTLAPNPQPSLMTLEAVLPDGRRLASAQSVALGPIAGPVVVAEVAPDASSEAVAEAAPDAPEATGPDAAVSEATVPETVGEAEPVPDAEPGTGAENLALAESGPTPAPAPEPASDPVSVPDAAPAPPVALLVTDEGATVVQAPVTANAGASADAGEVTAVLLEAISYSPTGAVQLSGRGQAGQAVRIYLDNAQVADAGIAATGLWQLTLGDTAPGIYTMRVDQIEGAGKVTARFETPFKRETLEALAALSQPAATDAVADPAPEAAAPGTGASATAAADAPRAGTDAPPTADAPQVAAAPTAPSAATDPAPAAPDPASAPAAVAADAAAVPLAPPPPVTVTVQPGFTLWGIARENFGAGVMYVQVYEANRDKIRNPDLIYPGQVFAIPQKP
ncbi:LysM peptidoglycan-binding domain-containing protein [Pseudotabrizicola sp. 4114]|uniref:LysM peptidoglycan-binding domain-containing protein n=1 Tax=Pseudotabrizicola sp. 4114 TaxID=2817731 RepID=UPI00285D069F|nr:nucleoid-associated protein YgaU [Pseudorhodobacter sp. 4114]